MLRNRIRNGVLVLALLNSTVAFADAETAMPPTFIAPSVSVADMNMQLYALERPDWYNMSRSAQKNLIAQTLYFMTRSQQNEARWRGYSKYNVSWQSLSPDTQRHILIDVLIYRELTTPRIILPTE